MSKIVKIIHKVSPLEMKNIVEGRQHILFTRSEMRDAPDADMIVAYLYCYSKEIFGECVLSEQRRVHSEYRLVRHISPKLETLEIGWGSQEGFVWDISQFKKYRKPRKLSALGAKTISGDWQYIENPCIKNH